MKRLLSLFSCFLVLVLSVFFPAVSAEGSITVKVGVYENQPKIFTDEDGTVRGFWPEIIEYIASEEGWQIEYVHGSWTQCLEMLENNEIDIMPDVAYTEERNELYDFSSEVVYTSWSKVYTTEGAGIQSVIDLEGKKVAVLKGSVNVEGPEGIKALVSSFGINCTFIEVDSYARVFELVESQEADAGVASKDFGNQHELEYNIVSTDIIFQPSLLYFAFSKNSGLAPELIERIDYHIKRLKGDNDSLYYQLLEKWFGVKPAEKTVIPGWLIWLLVSIGGLVILLGGGSFILRSQVRARTKELTQEMAERRKVEEKYSALVEKSNDGIIIIQDGVLKFTNKKMLEMTGFLPDEVIGHSFIDFISPQHKAMVADNYRRRVLGEDVPERYEIEIIARDGGYIPVDINASRIGYEEKPADMAIIRGITERKKAERRIAHLNSMMRALRNVNQLITRESDKERLIWRSCELILEARGFYTVWILLFNEKREYVSAAIAGSEGIKTSLLNQFRQGDYPPCISRIMEQKETFAVCNDIMGKEVSCLPRNVNSEGGGLIRRLEYEGKIYGAISVYVPSSMAYDPEEQSLFCELAGDISFALAAIERQEERKKIEEALRISEERWQFALEGAGDGVWDWNAQTNKVFYSRQWKAMLGYAEDEIGDTLDEWDRRIHPDDKAYAYAEIQKHLDGQTPVYSSEHRLLCKDGSYKWILDRGKVISRTEDGKPLRVIGTHSDITERKKAEQLLADEATRRRILIGQSRDGIVILDQDGGVYEYNQRFAEMIGYSPSEVPKLHVWDWEYVTPREKVLEMVRNVDEKGDHFETKHRRKDGSIYDVEISTNGAIFAGRKLVFCVCRDITERKKVEEALHVSERRYRTALDGMMEGCQIIGFDLRYIYLNDVAVMHSHYSREKLLGHKITEVYPGIEKTEMFANLKRCMEERVPISMENLFTYADGSQRWFDLKIEPVSEGVFVLSLDITERKEAEERIKIFSAAVAGAIDAIAITDMNGNIIWANVAMEKTYGYSREELIGRSALSLVNGRRKAEEILSSLRNTGSWSGEIESARKNKETFPGLLSISSVFDDSGKPIAMMGTIKDITERKKMEEQLILTDRLASVGELASGIAHELNNPLTGVIGLSEFIIKRDIPEDIRQDLAMVNSEAQRAARVVKNLLTFARKHPLVKQLLNINDVICKVLELRAYEQRVNNIQVVNRMAPELPQIMADYFQLQQVFLNIIINAEYFMIEKHGGGTLTITTEKADDFIRASFADDGPGIPPENISHIFDPFFTTKEVGKGTGLGLSISHGIIVAHGGRIYAESQLGSGATFIVELPIRQEE